ncbi:Ggt5 [Phodopus roborovskii]|uniref:Ggt5 protein n=1 Tax=Phodopus roborovskii TaxID=109678 RepID=A0AAU9ZCJ3_PHORO|nr:Ggt5 [Phodopus roborovskii]
MAWSHRARVCLVLLGLGLGLAIIVLAVALSRRHASCGSEAFAHAAVAADSKICSDIGRDLPASASRILGLKAGIFSGA